MGLATRYFFPSKVTVSSLSGALSDERSGLSFVSLLSIQSIVVTQYLRKFFNFYQVFILDRGVVSSVDIATGSWKEGRVQCLSLLHSICGPPSLLRNEYRGYNSRGVDPISSNLFSAEDKNGGVIPPLPNTSSWHSA
jgi:hypothetical protein